jgi:hypothetical protein
MTPEKIFESLSTGKMKMVAEGPPSRRCDVSNLWLVVPWEFCCRRCEKHAEQVREQPHDYEYYECPAWNGWGLTMRTRASSRRAPVSPLPRFPI